MPPATSGQYIFLDCNSALHYKRADQIDWCALAGSAEVVLVIAPVFLRELEEQKIVNGSKKLRHRADDAVRWLGSRLDGGNLEDRAGVSLHFIPHEPSLDFTRHRLSERIYDDQLIASVIEFSSEVPGQVRVATADIGLKAKLRARNIPVLALPDTARLPDEPDQTEKALAELRREHARLLARIPQLGLRFEDGQNTHAVTFLEADADVATVDHVRELRPFRQPKSFGPRATMIDILSEPEDVEAYNKQLEFFYSQWEKYTDAVKAWADQVALCFRVSLYLANAGSAKATDIDVELLLPNSVLALHEDELPMRPAEPSPPSLASRPWSLPRTPMPTFVPPVQNLASILRERDQPKLFIREGKRDLVFRVPSLKHGHVCVLPRFLLKFANAQCINSFGAEYTITAAEAPDPCKGTIVFKLGGATA
jgi:hypothetical protein